jgi:hypothetical protein
MARLKKIIEPSTHPFVTPRFEYANEVLLPDGFIVSKGEFFKIKGKNSFGVGEWGLQFKFYRLVTHLETGKQWVDCYEMFRGRAGVMRSFAVERIKRIPKRRKRRVNRKSDS